MIARVDGEEWGRGPSGEMLWTFEDVIAHVSASETLRPGEFIGSGAVGNGCGLEHLRFLEPGDVATLEVERIGTPRNRVLAPACPPNAARPPRRTASTCAGIWWSRGGSNP